VATLTSGVHVSSLVFSQASHSSPSDAKRKDPPLLQATKSIKKKKKNNINLSFMIFSLSSIG
jgi:hypothetical protein